MKRPASISVHAWKRRAQRAPRACHPNFGVTISRGQARKLGVADPRQRAADAHNRRSNRAIRRDVRPNRRGGGRCTYCCTATACWLIRGGVAVTLVELTDDQLASLLVWAACGVMP